MRKPSERRLIHRNCTYVASLPTRSSTTTARPLLHLRAPEIHQAPGEVCESLQVRLARYDSDTVAAHFLVCLPDFLVVNALHQTLLSGLDLFSFRSSTVTSLSLAVAG